jgi:hypothetical protein
MAESFPSGAQTPGHRAAIPRRGFRVKIERRKAEGSRLHRPESNTLLTADELADGSKPVKNATDSNRLHIHP